MNVTNGPPSTWARVRDAYRLGQRPADYPHRAAPHPSIYDDFDAAMAAAALLRANGADATLGLATWNAVPRLQRRRTRRRRLCRRRDGARSRVGTGAGTHQQRGTADLAGARAGHLPVL